MILQRLGFSAKIQLEETRLLYRMVNESWLHNLWETCSRNRSEKYIGVFIIDVVSLLSKLVHQWNSLSDNQLLKLREEITISVGIKNLVSDNDDYISDLIASEMLNDLESILNSVARFSWKCSDSITYGLRDFWNDNGTKKYYRLLSWWKEIEGVVMVNKKKYPKMETISDLEQILRRMKDENKDQDRKKFAWNKISLWSRDRDYIFLLLARSTFATLARFEHAFIRYETMNSNSEISDYRYFISGPFISSLGTLDVAALNLRHWNIGIAIEKLVTCPHDPPLGTLGAAALALHHANIIIAIERLATCPHLIGEARDDLYIMLPASVKISPRAWLKRFGNSLGSSSVYDDADARLWSKTISETLEWLAPLAHNMIKWQHEKSFRHWSQLSRTNVLLVQTLYYTSQEKTEATIIELLVGLNYVFRFGRCQSIGAVREG